MTIVCACVLSIDIWFYNNCVLVMFKTLNVHPIVCVCVCTCVYVCLCECVMSTVLVKQLCDFMFDSLDHVE